jgi:hypothetical protein
MNRIHRFVAVGSGLNYLDDSGQFQSSKDLIELMPDGSAAALHAPLKVRFSPNINTGGSISISTKSNRVFTTDILGLYWYDPVSGNRSLLSLIKDSAGELLPPNQIVYRSAFASIKGSVRFTCTRAALECDVILEQNLVPPTDFSPQTHLEVWHEQMGNVPTPAAKPVILQSTSDPLLRASMAEPDLTEGTLNFGDLWLPVGCAFSWPGDAPDRQTNVAAQIRVPDPVRQADKLPVAKRWVEVNQRHLVLESIPFSSISTKLASLPQASGAKPPSLSGKVFAKLLPPARPSSPKNGGRKAIKLAAAPYRTTGVLLDWIAVSGDGDYTFDSGTSYFVHQGYFGGTVTFQPNCVIKEDSDLVLFGTVVCNGTYDSPSLITTVGDDLFGDTLPEGDPTYNTHNPGDWSPTALWMYWGPGSVAGLKIRWAGVGVQIDGAAGSVSDAAFETCGTGIQGNDNGLALDNVTMCGVGTAISGVDSWALSGSYSDICSGDSNGNGLPDAWEVKYFGYIGVDANADPDGDGLTNFAEYLLGTNPTRPANPDSGGAIGLQVYTPLRP